MYSLFIECSKMQHNTFIMHSVSQTFTYNESICNVLILCNATCSQCTVFSGVCRVHDVTMYTVHSWLAEILVKIHITIHFICLTYFIFNFQFVTSCAIFTPWSRPTAFGPQSSGEAAHILHLKKKSEKIRLFASTIHHVIETYVNSLFIAIKCRSTRHNATMCILLLSLPWSAEHAQ